MELEGLHQSVSAIQVSELEQLQVCLKWSTNPLSSLYSTGKYIFIMIIHLNLS